MFLSWKLDKLTLFTYSLVGWNLKNLDQKAVLILFSHKLTFYARKISILESIFLQNKKWSRQQDFACKTSWLVRISFLTSAMTKGFAFFLGEVNL